MIITLLKIYKNFIAYTLPIIQADVIIRQKKHVGIIILCSTIRGKPGRVASIINKMQIHIIFWNEYMNFIFTFNRLYVPSQNLFWTFAAVHHGTVCFLDIKFIHISSLSYFMEVDIFLLLATHLYFTTFVTIFFHLVN